MDSRLRSPRFRLSVVSLLLLHAGIAALASESNQPSPSDSTPVQLARFFLSPAPEPKKEAVPPKEGAEPAPGETPAPAEVQTLPPGELLGPEVPTITAKTTKHEISASGDLLVGDGWVTLPIGSSLQKSLGGLATFPEFVASPTRDSTYYYGATLSYSYGQIWYFDFSFADGHSSGTQDLDVGPYGTAPTSFTIDDSWYQAYLRYTFPKLRGKLLSAYLRIGISYIQTDMKDESVFPAVGFYEQTDKVEDILGKLGFGVGYTVYSGRRSRLGLQLEGEGFYGSRSQESRESLASIEGIPFETVSIDNSLYGGIGRATVRLEYRLGQSGFFKIFADAGAAVQYNVIDYSDSGLGTHDELVWGPYVKVGVRYSF